VGSAGFEKQGGGQLLVANGQTYTGRNAVQQVQIFNAFGGNFNLSFNSGGVNLATTPLPVGASAAQVHAALEALNNIGVGNVQVIAVPGLNPGDFAYNVTFIGALAGINVATLGVSTAPPNVPAASGTATVAGGGVTAVTPVSGGSGYTVAP